jgi:hypothetical protein
MLVEFPENMREKKTNRDKEDDAMGFPENRREKPVETLGPRSQHCSL